MAVSPPVQIDRERIKELTEREERVLNENTSGSGEMYERAPVSYTHLTLPTNREV